MHLRIKTCHVVFAHNNYYHLILDLIAPLLSFIEANNIDKDSVTLYFSKPKMNNAFLEILQKYVLKNILPLDDAPSDVVDITMNTSYKAVIKWANTLREPYISMDKPSLVYISREGGKKRNVVNNAECIDALQNAFGIEYKVVLLKMEKLTFEEQIEAMANCKIVVAAHGAGLTNLLFMDKKTCCLEIFPEDFSYSGYKKICAEKNINYDYFHCKFINPPPDNYDEYVKSPNKWGPEWANTSRFLRDMDIKIDTQILVARTENLLNK